MTVETLPRPTKFADYALTRFLGENADAQVFAAEPPARLRGEAAQVLVKILRDKVAAERFHRAAEELQYVRALNSPHNVTPYEAGRGRDGTTYFALEYAPNGSLAGPARNVTRDDVLRAVACAARGAHALHEAGIVHRAIRPSHVLLAPDSAKIAEPDLMHHLCPSRTFHALRPTGLVQYLDPGIIRGDHPSRASDIWSLGVTLHSVLTGRPIYYHVGPDLIHALRTVLISTPVIDGALTEAEAAVVRACLQPDPGDRPTTALAVAEQIEALLGAPGSADHPTPRTVMPAEARPSAPRGGTATFETVSLLPAESLGRRDALARRQRRATVDSPLVPGLVCKRGHFNYPLASYCTNCGISLLQQTRRPVQRPRPVLGVLVLDDGSICNIGVDYVIGREPSGHEAVQKGDAQPLALDDRAHTVSGAHAQIHLDGWRVMLQDLGSPNGTAIRPPDSAEWTRLEAGEPTELHSRTTIRIGERTLVFSSNRER